MKRLQGIGIGIVVSAIALIFVLKDVDLPSLATTLAGGRYIYIVPCVLLVVVGLFFRGVRWRALLNYRITLTHSFNILNVSYLFNALLPFRLGEVVRAYLATRLQPPISMFTSLSSIVVERLLDMLAVVMLLAVGITLSTASIDPRVVGAAKVTGALAIVGLPTLAVFAAKPNLAQWFVTVALRIVPPLARLSPHALMDRILDGIAPLGSLRGFSTALLWTAVSWFFSVVAGYALMPMFFAEPNWAAALLIIAIASLAIALPAVPGNIGTFEAAIIVGLTAGGMVPDGDAAAVSSAVAFAVILHIINTLTYAVAGWIGLLSEQITFSQIMQTARNKTKRNPTGASPVGEDATDPGRTIGADVKLPQES